MNTAPAASSQRWLLVLLLLLAGLHAASAALVRPLFQVSDEVNYFASVQARALTRPLDPSIAACVGTPPQVWGGRRLFHEVGAAVLLTACRLGAGGAAPHVLRVVFGWSLVVITWCGWELARLATGRPLVQAFAALSLATQPVLAKYSAAITPDSLSNASAALAIVAAAGLIIEGLSFARLLMVGVGTIAAVASKENGVFLPVVHLFVLMAWAIGGPRQQRIERVLLATVGAVALAAAVYMLPTSYAVGPGLAKALDAPLGLAGSVTADAVARLPAFLASSYTSLGGFGGTAAALPPSAGGLAIGMWLVGLWGLYLSWRSATKLPSRLLAYLAAVGGACLLQAPARQVLLGMTDQHQGRWLFPVAVPVALALAVGLARVCRSRGWPLVALGQLTLMASALLSVIQFHVTSADWALDRAHLYLHSTGGFDIGVERTAAQVTRAWAATAPPVPGALILLCCLVCGALLLRCRPHLGTPHVHHADHR